MLIASGTITGGDGFNAIGCSLAVDIEINDISDFFEKQQNFGHHLAMVYGDYRRDIKELSKIMGFDVVES